MVHGRNAGHAIELNSWKIESRWIAVYGDKGVKPGLMRADLAMSRIKLSGGSWH